jgi:hypothetical protein
MGVPSYVVEHLRGAMADYQTSHMSGADNNIEKLTGRRSMTVGEFARAHLDKLNSKKNQPQRAGIGRTGNHISSTAGGRWQQNAALALPPRKGWSSCETGQ